MKKKRIISFLDVFVERDSENKLNTSVYMKCTSNDIYINWYAHAPNTWKIATLRNLIKRAFSISSTESFAEKEIKYLQNAFCMVDNIIKSEREWQHKILNDNEGTEAINTIDASTDIFTLILPHGGNKGDNIISKMKKNISNLLTTIPTGNKSKMLTVIYKSKKLSSKFQIKDKTKFKHA